MQSPACVRSLLHLAVCRRGPETDGASPAAALNARTPRDVAPPPAKPAVRCPSGDPVGVPGSSGDDRRVRPSPTGQVPEERGRAPLFPTGRAAFRRRRPGPRHRRLRWPRYASSDAGLSVGRPRPSVTLLAITDPQARLVGLF
ncbi:hypothetical protein IscW_ISCW015913 [Ixodes scapularis]|uniref:Uncharacterized protein n=1 Tax=Ixodes scapularis TaxID=6945 RepID=B7P1D5_IXOSC|nr:hypothetical protein IscW_ISCW015913 [Ixodes scapularis]|eukprot:XP_002433343.1 hypothetical protein IscW_ISCW015913 [Ixodes scapularis]